MTSASVKHMIIFSTLNDKWNTHQYEIECVHVFSSVWLINSYAIRNWKPNKEVAQWKISITDMSRITSVG